MKKANSLKKKFKTKFSSFNYQNNINNNDINIGNNRSQTNHPSSTGQTSSSLLVLANPEMVNGRHYFNEGHRTYSCIHCRTQLASHDELVSKLFQGNQGRAYLFNEVVNVKCRQPVRRQLLTGPHDVADIYCANCEITLGWKYEYAYMATQKYKEGKYIIELIHMYKGNQWDITSYNSQSIIREIDLACSRKFGVDDFTIGDNYFGSLDLLEREQRRIMIYPKDCNEIPSKESTLINSRSGDNMFECMSIDQIEKMTTSNIPQSMVDINSITIKDATIMNTNVTSSHIPTYQSNSVGRHSVMIAMMSNNNNTNSQSSENIAINNDSTSTSNNDSIIIDRVIIHDNNNNESNRSYLTMNYSSLENGAIRHEAPIDEHHQHHTHSVENHRKADEIIDISKLFIGLRLDFENSPRVREEIIAEMN